MKTLKVLIAICILFIIGFTLSIKKLVLTLTNASTYETLIVTYQIDNSEEISKVIPRTTSALEFITIPITLGNHNITVGTQNSDLKKRIRIFTLYKNYVDVEFQGDARNMRILTRKSWFGLTYM